MNAPSLDPMRTNRQSDVERLDLEPRFERRILRAPHAAPKASATVVLQRVDRGALLLAFIGRELAEPRKQRGNAIPFCQVRRRARSPAALRLAPRRPQSKSVFAGLPNRTYSGHSCEYLIGFWHVREPMSRRYRRLSSSHPLCMPQSSQDRPAHHFQSRFR